MVRIGCLLCSIVETRTREDLQLLISHNNVLTLPQSGDQKDERYSITSKGIKPLQPPLLYGGDQKDQRGSLASNSGHAAAPALLYIGDQKD